MKTKQPYLKPEIEEFVYQSELGYGGSMVDVMHYGSEDPGSARLFLGGDRHDLATGEEITEYTDGSGEFTMGTWE